MITMVNELNFEKNVYPPGSHPTLPPPVSQRGLYKWTRESLFNTWYNSIATIVGLYILWIALPPAWDWLIGSATWEAQSNKDCRAGAGGACWGFIKARFVLFMYGFYDAESLWRPNLAGILLITFGVPVVVPKIPGTRPCAIFLIFVYPWIAVSLLGGPIKISILGSDVGVISTILIGVFGFLLGYQGHRTKDSLKKTIGFAIAYIVLILFFLYWGLGLSSVETSRYGGLLLTLVLAITAIVVSLPLSILLALGRRATGLPVVMYFCIAVIELFRAVPLITVLFMAQFMIPLFLPQGFSFDDVVMALIGMIIFFAAYLAEVVRGGLQAIPKGQYEAADSMGLNYFKSMRLIVLPQALKIVIPGIVSTFIAITKDTSLVMIIGLFDLLNITKSSITDAKWLGLEWEGYAFVALVFWILCFSMSRYSQWLEKRLDTGHRS